jgi:chromosome segregation ATPase
MPYGDSPAGMGGSGSSIMRIDWKSALFGGAVMMAASYVGVMRPAHRQITALETQVGRLAASVESLNASREGVHRATSLLGRIEAQAARLAAAESAVARFEAIGHRLITQAPTIAAAGEALDGIDSLHNRIAERAAVIDDVTATVGEIDELTARVSAARDTTRAAVAAVDKVRSDLEAGTARLTAAETAADRLAGLARSLAAQEDNAAEAALRLDLVAGLQHRLLRTTADLEAADAAITRLTDINTALADASGTLGRLQRFVVDIVLLEPTFSRAVRALEPVVEFTAAGRKLEVKGAGSESVSDQKPSVVREVARAAGDEAH